MSLGERIKVLRRESGLTQDEFGRKYELNKATISGYETGIRNPDLNFLVALSDAHNVSLDWLLGRTDSRDFATPPPDMTTGLSQREIEEVQDFANYLRMKKIMHPNKREDLSTCEDTIGGGKTG